MDFDGAWLRYFIDMGIAALVAGVAAVLTLLGWRKADRKEIKEEIAKDFTGVNEDVDSIRVDIEKIKERLGRGDNRMTRIEEKLKHIPTQKQIADIDAKLAALQESHKGTKNIVEVIRDHLVAEAKK